ncbi:MAG TPA: hypothetical protein VMW16_02945 [Sedimentisphaerales bacterium]|nr:hypothetical protein [Sedimentisphaerales bacterium]
MRNDNEKVDLLLEQNAAQQLAGFDWEALSAAISSRLDQLSQRKTLVFRIPTAFKIAVGLAAIILIAVMITVDMRDDLRLANGQRAVVRFAGPTGTASVEIGHALAKSEVFVDVGPAPRTLAKCEVQIIDVEGEREKSGVRAAWIIISRPKPAFADNGTAKDMRDLICMF